MSVNLVAHGQLTALLVVVEDFAIVWDVQARFVVEANGLVAEVGHKKETVETFGLTTKRHNRF